MAAERAAPRATLSSELRVRRASTPSAEVTGALKTLMRHDVSQMPVERDGKLEGMLRHRDIVRWLELRSDLQAA